MDLEKLSDIFSCGILVNSGKTFENISWYPHPEFEGVEMKNIVTSKESEGKFSYHLVKIKAKKRIGLHIHEKQLETHEVILGSGVCRLNNKEFIYKPGSITIFPAKTEHEITAGAEGLYILAKFIPALC
jgi:quercetin dioxygenase-like cupin family protein